MLEIKKIIDTYRPHVLQTWLYHADFLGMITKLLFNIPNLIWNIRCSDMDFSKYSFTTKMLVWVMSKMSHVPNAVVTNSNSGLSIHKTYGYHPQRWKYIPNGIDTQQFRPDEKKRQTTRTALGIENEASVIGMVARYDPKKDHKTFFVAAEKYFQYDPNAVFILVGREVEISNKALMEMIRFHRLGNNIFLLGERMDMHDIYPCFDVLSLSSSFGEGFPNVLGEAMACGVPCVSTNVGDASIIIDDAGAVVPVGDADAMFKKWTELLSISTSQRKALGNKLREKIQQCYSIEMVTSIYERLYIETVTG